MLSFEQMVTNKDFQRFWNKVEAIFKSHCAPYCKASQNVKCKHCSQLIAELHLLIVTSLKFFQTLVSSIPGTLATKLTLVFFKYAL